MTDKKSAPAFSMGVSKKYEFGKPNGLPGPGQYNMSSTMKTKQALTTTSKDARFGSYATFVPGPGQYDSNKTAHITSAMILSKSQQKKPDGLPGPGAYDGQYQKFMKSQSGYQIGHAQRLPDDTKRFKHIPGPGEYETGKSTLLEANKGMGFGPERKIVLGIDPKTPGPGQYLKHPQTDRFKPKSPNFSFSKTNRTQSLTTISPGPGNYPRNSTFNEKDKGYKMGMKYKPIKENAQSVPGPGNYRYQFDGKKSQPNFSIGKEEKLKIDNERQFMTKPSFNQYNPNVSAFSKKTFSIGKDQRKGLESNNKIPGPGSYEIKNASNQPQFSISKSDRKSMADGRKIPGPGEYTPKMVQSSQFQPIGMTKDQRTTFKIQDKNPGPGNYLLQQKLGGGGFSIGSDKRSQKRIENNPGPGNYNIPSSISNLPSFVRSSK